MRRCLRPAAAAGLCRMARAAILPPRPRLYYPRRFEVRRIRLSPRRPAAGVAAHPLDFKNSADLGGGMTIVFDAWRTNTDERHIIVMSSLILLK